MNILSCCGVGEMEITVRGAVGNGLLKNEERRRNVVIVVEEKEEEEEEEKRKRRRRHSMNAPEDCTFITKNQKTFPFRRFQFSVPPLPSGKCRDLVSEGEK